MSSPDAKVRVGRSSVHLKSEQRKITDVFIQTSFATEKSDLNYAQQFTNRPCRSTAEFLVDEPRSHSNEMIIN